MTKDEYFEQLQRLGRIYDEMRGMLAADSYQDLTLGEVIAERLAQIEDGIPERKLEGRLDYLDMLMAEVIKVLKVLMNDAVERAGAAVSGVGPTELASIVDVNIEDTLLDITQSETLAVIEEQARDEAEQLAREAKELIGL
jgi:hypothetical protein